MTDTNQFNPVYFATLLNQNAAVNDTVENFNERVSDPNTWGLLGQLVLGDPNGFRNRADPATLFTAAQEAEVSTATKLYEDTNEHLENILDLSYQTIGPAMIGAVATSVPGSTDEDLSQIAEKHKAAYDLSQLVETAKSDNGTYNPQSVANLVAQYAQIAPEFQNTIASLAINNDDYVVNTLGNNLVGLRVGQFAEEFATTNADGERSIDEGAFLAYANTSINDIEYPMVYANAMRKIAGPASMQILQEANQ